MKRIIGIVLAIAMILTLLPMIAFADSSPADFGWGADYANWEYWSATADSLSVSDLNAAATAGANGRAWKSFINDSTFTFRFDIKIEPNARAYVSILGVATEFGRGGDGVSYWQPNAGAWVTADDGWTTLKVTRENGGDINFEQIGAGGASYKWTAQQAAATALVEVGMWNHADDGFSMRNISYKNSVDHNPGDFGWCSDGTNWTYWTAENAGTFTFLDANASNAAGGNMRVWKDIIADSTFALELDLKVDMNARVYFNILGITTEYGTNGDYAYFVPQLGWTVPTDNFIHIRITRENGGDLTYTMRPTGYAETSFTATPTSESGAIEFGMWNSDNNGFTVRNLTYSTVLPGKPGDFGWVGDTADWSYWMASDAGNFKMFNADASHACGSNNRLWKNILTDTTFNWSFDVKVDPSARIYMNLLGVTLEFGAQANGTDYWQPAVSSWVSSSDGWLNLNVAREDGGDLSFTLTTTEGTAYEWTAAVTNEIPTVEIGFWNSANNGFAIRNMIYTAHTHNFVAGQTILPTCTEDGYTIYTCTCGETENRDFVDALGHAYTYTNNGADHTVGCSRCDYSVTEAHNFESGVCVCGAVEAPAKISSAYLTLSDNIDLTYAVEVAEDCTDAAMTFTMNGITRTVTDYTEDADGKRLYTFTGITPQCMGDTVTAVFTAKIGGETFTDTVAEYSIRQYCENQLERYADDAKLVTLLSDLLTYGAAAQTYTGYKTDALVTAGLDLTPSIFDTIPAAKAVFSGEASEVADWSAATLTLRNAPAVRLYFTADSIENLTVTAELNGREQVFTAADFRTADEGKYYVEFTGITATEFDDAVTARFAVNGEPVGRAISYSVNSYISGTQNVENADLQALVRALYNYGASAKAY